MPESVVTSRVGMQRIAIGLLQGLALYLLHASAEAESWPASSRLLFAPLLLVCLIAPVLWISSLGHLDRMRTAVWLLVSAALIAGLGLHDVWRGDTGSMMWPQESRVRYPSSLLVVFLCAGFFIGHSLLLAAARDRRRVAGYATHFETAWKLAIQLAFSALFVGVLWLALFLGSALFMLVKLSFLQDLLREPWFAIPVSAFGFACAMHITDVRPAIVRGIRSLLLVLLSWILPVTVLIFAGFLASLPVTGLQPLWATRSATAVLLGAAAGLVVLINAAYQNGEVSASVARLVRFSARLASLILMPIVALAVYALALRVEEYGWTADRVIAAACLFVAGLYAIGYAWAALGRTQWMRAAAPVNVIAAYLILAVLLALFSPLADPARLSVNDQVARLRAERIAAEQFDFGYLRFNGARYGQAALAQFKDQASGKDADVISRKAKEALKLNYPDDREGGTPAGGTEIAANITVWPEQEKLPASFFAQDWSTEQYRWNLPGCMRRQQRACDAFLIDVSGDGKKDVVLLGDDKSIFSAVLTEGADGSWSVFGHLPQHFSECESLRQQMKAGEFRAVEPVQRDLEAGGIRIEIQRNGWPSEAQCPPAPN